MRLSPSPLVDPQSVKLHGKANLVYRCLLVGSLLLASASAFAQKPATVTGVDQLASTISELRAKAAASSDGSASMKLDEYPNHFSMLALRTRTGGAEVHKQYADVFVVLKGNARLASGGKLEAPRDESGDEPRGTAVLAGHEQAVKPGDIIHIPAGMPHQLLIKTGEEFVYYVYKIHE